MIEEAKKRNSKRDIKYITSDVEEYLTTTNATFGVVLSVATFHYLDMGRVLKIIRTKLGKGGVLLILDLYKRHTLYEYMLSILATLCNPIVYLIK